MRYDDHILKIYQNSFRNNWDLPALTDYGSQEVMTYADFARRIARLHLFYRQIGLKPGDHVALLGKNSASWVVMFIGTITYGATIVPILADFNPHDAQHIVNHSDARVLFVNSSIWETLDFEEMPELKAAVSLETRQVLAERETEGHQIPSRIIRNLTRKFKATYPKGFRREDVVYPEIDAENTAILNYTSGTTGFSKGVMLTYDNIAGNVNYGIVSRLHYEGSRALSFLPLAHAYGCAFDMLVPLAVGTFITIFGKAPTPKLLLKAFSEVKPNLVICVPLILEKIYRKQIVPMITKRAIRWALAVPFIDNAIYAKNPQQACRGIRRPVRGGDYRRSAAQQRSGAIPVPHQIPIYRGLRNDRVRPADQPYALEVLRAGFVRTNPPLHGIENHGEQEPRDRAWRDMRARAGPHEGILQGSRRDGRSHRR